MTPQPNVLFITADQHLATCVGHEGHPQVITPNLDRLASQGTWFRHAYKQNPICTPSRVSFYSGQYCHNHGYFGLGGPRPVALPSLLSHFRGQGYLTAGIGNLHTPDHPDRNWLADHLDLFDDTFRSIEGKHLQTAWHEDLRRRGLDQDEDFLRFICQRDIAHLGMPSRLAFEHSQEGWCVKSAVRFMEQCAGKPFCIHVSLERPHDPVWPARQFWDMYPDDLDLPPTVDQDPAHRPPHFQAMARVYRADFWTKDNRREIRNRWRGYLASITHTDHAVGLILDHLDRAGLAQHTIVIYTADHGAYAGTHGVIEKAPGICSDAVCRVPMIWRYPGVISAGVQNRQFVELVDIAPTIASLCGLPAMESVDGCDISGLLRGGDDAVREVAVTEHPWSKSLRWKNWRFVHYQRAMFDGQDVGELYDIDADPNETRNFYHDAEHQPIVHECRRLLMEWLIRTTRVRTAHPNVCKAAHEKDRPATSDQAALQRRHFQAHEYDDAGDGKEPNTAGPAARLRAGHLNYL